MIVFKERIVSIMLSSYTDVLSCDFLIVKVMNNIWKIISIFYTFSIIIIIEKYKYNNNIIIII